jgi:hypothetical protein
MADWKCPEKCNGLTYYEKGHWNDPKFLLGYECPDDLGYDEVCPNGILNDDEKGRDKHMNFKDMWNTAAKADISAPSFEDLPEGTYIAEVLSCKLGPTKAGDKDMVSWDLKVVEGQYKNSHIFVYRPFSKTDESEQNVKAINRALDDFKILGLDCTAEALAKSMRDIVGKKIEISLKNGNSGQFKNFKRIVEDVPTVNAEIISDDVPF